MKNLPGWLVIGLIVVGCGVLSYVLSKSHPNYSVDDYVKLAALWFTLSAAVLSAWISHHNATRQIESSQDIADEQRKFTERLETTKNDLQSGIEVLKTSLARELEEAKVRIAQRYQAQVTLNEEAMAAADHINALQGGAPDTAKARELVENIKMASERMQSKRGALLMVPKDYREAWEELQQHVVYIAERLSDEIAVRPQMDIRAFFSEYQVGSRFIQKWAKFNKVAAYD
jgi:hypothetical protein